MSADVRVLVTGAGGQLGGHAARLLAQGGKEVYGTVRAPSTATEPSGIRWLRCDFTKPDEVRAAVEASNPSLVLHTVGLGGTSDVGALTEANVTTLGHLINALDGAQIKNLLVIGSSAEYAASNDGVAIREDHPLGPASPYGVSKLQQFELARKASKSGLPIVYGRPFNLIGPGVSSATAVGDITRRLAEATHKGGSRILAVGDLDKWRDYLDVRDAAAACAMLLDRGMPGEDYNICSGVPVLLSEVVNRLLAMTGGHVSLRRVDRGPSQGFVVGDPSRLRGLGWTPKYDLDSSLRDGLEHAASRLTSAM
ncbi:MAG TPA: NAD-dependent epimerase/dehydratase family protein [Candidatus Micrarchaeaceae archaeon]|nr:NAD-dependent epimerase/dehydratase family protein [Candidatus Micrarchaeaceae archaeon]